MATSEGTIRIGYVPEHYLTPLHLAARSAFSSLPFSVSLTPFPSGTGHMISSLRQNEIDIGIGLTEGWVAGLVGKEQANKGADVDGGYKMVGQWVETPLRWAIVTGRKRNDILNVDDVKGGRVGVSRLGSGSHVMSFVLAKQQNWPPSSPLSPVILGPFSSLRDGVVGDNLEHSDGSVTAAADFFMWEQFTTKPYFDSTPSTPSPPLKKIGEIFTPWPSWHIAASTATFPKPEDDPRLLQLLNALDQGIVAFESNTEGAISLLGTGELGCTYSKEDASEWLKDVRFVKAGTRGVRQDIIVDVVAILKRAGVVPEDVESNEAVKRVAAASYRLVDEYAGKSFFDKFDFFTGKDPTEGFVEYVSEEKAWKNGLIGFSTTYFGDNQTWLGVDRTNIAPKGRRSVRITSKKAYNQGLFIADFAHVPGNMCGAWPAFWMLGPNWPYGGEIDIYEGVNLEVQNSVTLHTGPNCTISQNITSTGRVRTTNCDVAAPGQKHNEGCQISSRDPRNYGTRMNAAGGGLYATLWTKHDIKVWFLPRRHKMASDIAHGRLHPESWGRAMAHFTGNCSFTKSFRDLKIVINTTFCGVWAGRVWASSPCASVSPTCENFVANYPEAFRQTYWAINSLKVYQ
ncbi:hypothetical protein LOZ64_000599 [Ophidiomyces ophidiicola]|nr:hypothetical protein LOZ64_000599 [Ophidiomyces ophidiicola]KAI2015865.1 hypothetical protein LOZ49_000450 [Ophidiomyces ophidiicola]KAI2026450.1 hypothetical protein LOZ46_000442 [Ophidiomyces ophidiicola]KAI2145217.1 hypothetical protein LOZ29_000380 [Ophidiomyces ophidiicola]KAI2147565.1 hypothetical protein LOZ28_000080 [Ophidiomyces ophidiicola]